MGDEPEPVGELGVEREKTSVVLTFERDDGDDVTHHIHPHQAVKVAMWLNQAAADAKKYARSNDE